MTQFDHDAQTVADLTDEWIRCVATKNVARVAELLTEDFVYSRHPKWGDAKLSKAELLAFMPSIEASDTHVVERHLHRFDTIMLVHTETRANQKVAEADESEDPDRNKSFANKRLLDSAAWRKDGGTWRCFDYRMLEALD